MIRTGLQYAYEHRQWIASIAFSGVVGFFFLNPSRGREASTLAYLSLHGRLTDENFKGWVEKTHDKVSVERAVKNPEFYLFRTHLLTDFARKLVLPTFLVACSIFSIQNITLTEALQKLLLQSSKTSRVAIPALDLLSIACAPAAMKAVHMLFLHLNADKRHKYESLKNLTGFLADKLESFSYLTFALYCLGTSKTFYPTMIYTIAFLAFEKLFPEKALYFPMVGQYITYTEYSKNPETWFQSAVHNIFYSDTYPTQDFASGVNLFLSSLRSSSDPYDGKLLKQLYDKVTHDENVHFEEINDAYKAGKINREHAEALKKLNIQSIAEKIVRDELVKMSEKFEALLELLKEQPELQAIAKEVLKTYYAKLFNQLGEQAFQETGSHKYRKAFYMKLKEQIEEILGSVDTAVIKDIQEKCRAFSTPILPPEVMVLVQQATLSDVETTALRSALKKLLPDLLPRIDEAMKKEVVEVGCLTLEQKKVLYEKVSELFDAYLNTNENEKQLTKLFGMNGLFNKFHSVDPDDYYVSIEYDHQLFHSNMRYYIANQAAMGKEEELMLASQAVLALIQPKKVMQTPAFFKGLSQESQQLFQRNPEAAVLIPYVNQHIPKMPEFEYRRLTAIKLPDGFKFTTKALAYWFYILNSQTAVKLAWDEEAIQAEMQEAKLLSTSKEFRKIE